MLTATLGASPNAAPVLAVAVRLPSFKKASSILSVGHGVGPKDETGRVDGGGIGLRVDSFGGLGNTSSLPPRISSSFIVGDEVEVPTVVGDLLGAPVSSLPEMVGGLVGDAVGASVLLGVLVSETVGEMVGASSVLTGAVVGTVPGSVGEIFTGEMVGALGGSVSIGLFA